MLRNKIVFFIPGQDIILSIFKQTVFEPYLVSLGVAHDMMALEDLLDKGTHIREQLVFIGTERRTGMEPEDLAKLIKNINPKAHVVLSSVTPQEYTAPVDGFVLLSSPREIRALVDLVMSRA